MITNEPTAALLERINPPARFCAECGAPVVYRCRPLVSFDTMTGKRIYLLVRYCPRSGNGFNYVFYHEYSYAHISESEAEVSGLPMHPEWEEPKPPEPAPWWERLMNAILPKEPGPPPPPPADHA